MSKFAFCGNNCEVCKVYLVTQSDNLEGKKKLAEEWNKEDGLNFKAEDIYCDGCTDGRVFGNFFACEPGIRICAMEKMKVSSCAHCMNYPCDTLSKFLDQAPELKANLESIRIRRNS